MTDDLQDAPPLIAKSKKARKNKPKRKYTKRAVDPENTPDAYAAVASVKDTAPDDLQRLLGEISDLKAKLASETTKRTAAEATALAAAESQGLLMQREIEEVPTGKMVTVKRADGYKVVGHKEDGRDILRPIWKDVELPTYFYKIDMPPCGGIDAKINGVAFSHGTVYELDIDSLRNIKDIVYRLWKHDAEIHGSDENFYRRPQKTQISARAYR